MRRLLVAIIVVGFALPAAADDCMTVHVGHDGWTHIESIDNPIDEIRTAIVGTFIWFDYSQEPGGSAGERDTVSFDVSDPDVESATACADGSVTINTTEPADEQPVLLQPLCEIYPDVLEYVCQLPDFTLRIR